MNQPFKFLKSSEREGDDKGDMMIYVYKSPWGRNDDSEDGMCSAEQSLKITSRVKVMIKGEDGMWSAEPSL